MLPARLQHRVLPARLQHSCPPITTTVPAASEHQALPRMRPLHTPPPHRIVTRNHRPHRLAASWPQPRQSCWSCPWGACSLAGAIFPSPLSSTWASWSFQDTSSWTHRCACCHALPQPTHRHPHMMPGDAQAWLSLEHLKPQARAKAEPKPRAEQAACCSPKPQQRQ